MSRAKICENDNEKEKGLYYCHPWLFYAHTFETNEEPWISNESQTVKLCKWGMRDCRKIDML